MKIAIMQPTFLPWLGYFYIIKSVDKFVFLDSVQFERRSWQSRNKIKLNDKEFFLSLCCQKSPQKTQINDILLSKEPKWREKILNTIHHTYSKSINFKNYFEFLKNELFVNENLSDFNINLIKKFMSDLGIYTPIYRASKLNLSNAKREDLLLEICLSLNADSYLSPEGSRNYLQSEHSKQIFNDNKIKIEYLNFAHPIYKQQGKNFVPYLGIIDFLFNIKDPKSAFNEVFLQNGGGSDDFLKSHKEAI
ncbi:WbqC family protein [Campylobacter gastrosuis]|uniref:WbqC family protein n=1 Tax=Campylobacter gastrosuis TaxID=2974576 RepID=A0ABT7HM83_9BACT|nr:WbqC family protein [Campylobacter gastrosuis]MDL0087835.1 WbqC family protein [Campylobacter gastrosuis]MDL0088046.1 WbqC family protein [Campylobacter gastrosuis]